MQCVLLFVCITWVAAQCIHAQRTVTESPRITVPHPETANPEQDCTHAIVRHDLRFVGVAGYALYVPGVADYQARYWKTNGVKIIARTSDLGNRAFNEAARKYARRYNAQLLKYLSTHRACHAKDLTSR
jgi:hypothetical protein